MNIRIRHLLTLILVSLILLGCMAASNNETSSLQNASKIKFLLDNIHADGLRGPPGGKTSVAYEFCVPTDNRNLQEVRQIDPNVQIYQGSKGRIGCTSSQTLIIGSTSQPHWKEVLTAISALPYVLEIQEAFFE